MTWDDEEFFKWYDRWRRRAFSRSLFEDFDRDWADFDKMVENMFGNIRQKIPEDLVKERKLPDGTTIREMGPIVYGYSVTIGPDGKPVIREFGNVKPSERTMPFSFPRKIDQISEKREPLVDVMSEGDIVKVIAEVPGVEKSDISLTSTETSLTISVDAQDRKYYKELELPTEVEPKSAQASYKNGVLQVTLRKKTKTPGASTIKVE